ncbi:hypothetical protein [Streptomyces sp. NPDC057702]|uniref:hypothetical protein n=1 Tax=unclassified Streptomyces TaxID=2593676 RepID=UPI003674C367
MTHLVFEGAHRVVVRGVALRFFLRTDDVWAPVTDLDFQHAYELALFDPDALRQDVLCPNARRFECNTVVGWYWSDGCGSSGLCTFDDRTPDECAGMAQFGNGQPAPVPAGQVEPPERRAGSPGQVEQLVGQAEGLGPVPDVGGR